MHRQPEYHAQPLPSYLPASREYELTVRQEPKQARMCGVGGKADRRPIDPPPIIQLRVIDPLAASTSSGRGKQGSPRRSCIDSVDEGDHEERDGLVVFFWLINVDFFF